MIYDLIVIGNGIFANVFLHELNMHVNKSQNFRVAKVYSEELAPNCSLRTTSTVSRNGIEEGISPLGDTLLKSYLAFEAFSKINNLCGIYPINQYLLATDKEHQVKLSRRYHDQLKPLNHPLLNDNFEGVLLDSFMVIPEEMFKFLASVPKNYIQDDIQSFVESIEERNDYTEIVLVDKTILKAKKVVIATGAYSRINYHLFANTLFKEKIMFTKIVAGSYLKKQFDYPTNLYFTINGHNLVYRQKSQELIIGSTSVNGAITAPDLFSLKQIFSEVKAAINLDLGLFNDYQVITGLRHKGQKRIPFFESISESKNIWFFNGAYKNGWSLPFYFAKEKAALFI